MTTRGRLSGSAPTVHWSLLSSMHANHRHVLSACGSYNAVTTLDPDAVTCKRLACEHAALNARRRIEIACTVDHEVGAVHLRTPLDGGEVEVLTLPGAYPFRWTRGELFDVRRASMLASETFETRAALTQDGVAWTP